MHATGPLWQALKAQNAEFSMNDIERESAIAAPLHLVSSREEPAQTFKDVLVDLSSACLAARRHEPAIVHAFAAMREVWDIKPAIAAVGAGQSWKARARLAAGIATLFQLLVSK
jgi:hypothetical protein